MIKHVFVLLFIILSFNLTACGNKPPMEIQSICRESVLLNTFIANQANVSISNFANNENKTMEESFYESIEEARLSTKDFDFSRAYRADGKPFSDWKRNEGPIEIIVPHREKDNARTVICQITKDNDGEYLFSYPANLLTEMYYAGRTVDDVQRLLSSDEAWAAAKKGSSSK